MPQPGSNGFDPQKIHEYVNRIEEQFSELLSARGVYMNQCRGIRERIKTAYDDARADGLPRRELKTVLKVRELERKIEESITVLEADERQNYEMLEQALGDLGNTPLGKAALDRARPQGDGDGTLDTLTQ